LPLLARMLLGAGIGSDSLSSDGWRLLRIAMESMRVVVASGKRSGTEQPSFGVVVKDDSAVAGSDSEAASIWLLFGIAVKGGSAISGSDSRAGSSWLSFGWQWRVVVFSRAPLFRSLHLLVA
jgi:hypothetical protein